MSARKLSRLAGFAFVLAAVFGGVGAASTTNAAETSDVIVTSTSEARTLDIIWV